MASLKAASSDLEAPEADGESHRHVQGASGVLVTFENINFSVKVKRRRWVTLLDAVTGFFCPAQMAAIIGKSTLLDILAKRKTVGRLAPAARVLYNGQVPSAAFVRRTIGYVEQQDTLLSMLTPSEMLLYTAELKLPRHVPRKEKEQRVQTLLARLSLEDCQHTLIGSVLARGISGGEAKRTNIGIALVTHPAVLYLDEPTSGLDSFIAFGVMEAVRQLVSDGITIAATINSPTPQTFELFDALLVLHKGKLVYFGPSGEAALSYFNAAVPGLRPMRRAEGIADWIIDVTSAGGKAEGDTNQSFAKAYQASQLKRDNEQALQQQLQAVAAAAEHQAHNHASSGRSACCSRALSCIPEFEQSTVTPVWFALLVLWRFRSLRSFKRPEYIGPRAADKLVIVFLMCTIYWSKGDDINALTVTPISAILFMWVVTAAYGSMGVLPGLVLERPIYLRERADGLYTPATYLVHKVAEELLVAFLASVPLSLLVFYLVRLQGSFVLFWQVYVASMSISTILAMLAGAASPSLDVAGAALPAYTTALLYFSGFLIPWSKIPVYWKWFAVIDYLRYSWGAVMANQFAGDRNVQAYGPQPVLDYYSLNNISPWAWLGWCWLFFTVFLVATWAALAFMTHQRR